MKWEYSVIRFRGELCYSVDLLASDVVLGDMRGSSEEMCLIRMGNRGWELVSVVVEFQNQKSFYFKRPKQ
jgi:hypothetical protein